MGSCNIEEFKMSKNNFDDAIRTYETYLGGYTGNAPMSESDYDEWNINFPDIFSDKSPPSWLELKEKMDDMFVQWQRRHAYPKWNLQLEKIYDDGIDKWKTEMIDPVKAKYPKP